MNRLRLLVRLMAVLGFALPAQAHRLDEYLQATRIDISSNCVEMEMDLTPGVEVASVVLGLVDTNHDGRISAGEGTAYAELVLKTVVLAVDHQRHEVKLESVYFPSIEEMRSGTGIIRLKARAEFAAVLPGPHQLYFQNRHQAKLSVYLINAYVPKSPAIQITRQSRDTRQTEIRIDYTFATSGAAAPPHRAVVPVGSDRPKG